MSKHDPQAPSGLLCNTKCISINLEAARHKLCLMKAIKKYIGWHEVLFGNKKKAHFAKPQQKQPFTGHMTYTKSHMMWSRVAWRQKLLFKYCMEIFFFLEIPAISDWEICQDLQGEMKKRGLQEAQANLPLKIMDNPQNGGNGWRKENLCKSRRRFNDSECRCGSGNKPAKI